MAPNPRRQPCSFDPPTTGHLLANGLLIGDWLGGRPFDPYPFILLNLVLSFQAAYTGPVVLMSQNRQAAKDRDEAEHDYDVNRDTLRLLQRLDERQSRVEAAVDALGRGDGASSADPP